jgi:hypothetical protein
LPASALRSRSLSAALRQEVRGETADVQRVEHDGRRRGDDQAAASVAELAEGLHQHAESRRVDERNIGQIEVDDRRPGSEYLSEPGLHRRPGREVELAFENKGGWLRWIVSYLDAVEDRGHEISDRSKRTDRPERADRSGESTP